MEIQSTAGTNRSTDYEVGAAGGMMGKNEFMKMLVAQMKNQDPTDPMDNSQMTAQLAQFSSLEQMENLNSKFEGLQQSTTAALSLMNSGSPVELELANGAIVNGTLEKVQWIDGETQFVVDGLAYSSGDITSLQAAAAATTTTTTTTDGSAI